MFLDVVLYLMLGFFLGVVAGLVPGLHPNTIALLMLGAGTALALPVVPLVSLIVSCSVVNSFVNFIPSIYLGAPEDDSALSVLPGHRLLLDGLGHHAVVLTVMGGLGSFVFCVLLLPLILTIVPALYESVRPHTHLLLSGVVVYMLSKSKKRLSSLLVFGVSGILGFIALQVSEDMVFPLLSGLFGLSLLYVSSRQRTFLPEQRREVMRVDKRSFGRASVVGGLAGLIAGLLPGIGSAQATVFAQEVGGTRSTEEFLMAIGGVNTADIVFSFLALFLIGNPRSGAAIVVGELMRVGPNELFLMLAVSLVSVGFAAIATIWLSKVVVRHITRLNYRLLSNLVFIFIACLVYAFSGGLGLVFAGLAFFVGLLCIKTGVRKSFMMGVLIVPTVVYFL